MGKLNLVELNLVDQLLNPSRKQWDVQLRKGSRKTRVQSYELRARETSKCRPQSKWGDQLSLSSCLEHHLEFEVLAQFDKYFVGTSFAGTICGAGDLAINQADMLQSLWSIFSKE